MKKQYRVRGMDEESGTPADDIVAADSPAEAEDEAAEHGIHAGEVTESSVRPAPDSQQPRPMPPFETIEKTTPHVRPRVLTGWALLIVSVPVTLLIVWTVAAWLDIGRPAVITGAVIGLLILAAGFFAFLPYLRR